MKKTILILFMCVLNACVFGAEKYHWDINHKPIPILAKAYSSTVIKKGNKAKILVAYINKNSVVSTKVGKFTYHDKRFSWSKETNSTISASQLSISYMSSQASKQIFILLVKQENRFFLTKISYDTQNESITFDNDNLVELTLPKENNSISNINISNNAITKIRGNKFAIVCEKDNKSYIGIINLKQDNKSIEFNPEKVADDGDSPVVTNIEDLNDKLVELHLRKNFSQAENGVWANYGAIAEDKDILSFIGAPCQLNYLGDETEQSVTSFSNKVVTVSANSKGQLIYNTATATNSNLNWGREYGPFFVSHDELGAKNTNIIHIASGITELILLYTDSFGNLHYITGAKI